MITPAIRRVGRPRTRPESEGAGDYIGLRVPKLLKEQIAQAARESGRSLSTEVRFRLEQSFDRQWILSEVVKAITRASR